MRARKASSRCCPRSRGCRGAVHAQRVVEMRRASANAPKLRYDMPTLLSATASLRRLPVRRLSARSCRLCCRPATRSPSRSVQTVNATSRPDSSDRAPALVPAPAPARPAPCPRRDRLDRPVPRRYAGWRAAPSPRRPHVPREPGVRRASRSWLGQSPVRWAKSARRRAASARRRSPTGPDGMASASAAERVDVGELRIAPAEHLRGLPRDGRAVASAARRRPARAAESARGGVDRRLVREGLDHVLGGARVVLGGVGGVAGAFVVLGRGREQSACRARRRGAPASPRPWRARRASRA